MDNVVVDALGWLVRGRSDAALDTLTAGRDAGGGRLRDELAEYLSARHDGQVYEAPAAFLAFISGGGNAELRQAAIARLTAAYRDLDVRGVLDIGCGDGRTVVPAAAAMGRRAPELDLVDPSAALLADAAAAARAAGLTARAHNGTVQQLLSGQQQLSGVPACWDLAEATFALHAIPPRERTNVLTVLRARAHALLIMEFDVPAFRHGSPEHLAYLARRYEIGLAQYEGSLVAQGFLMPVLVGQLDPGQVRHTWEQPAAAWTEQLSAAGWRHVAVAPLPEYWWAPPVLITATA